MNNRALRIQSEFKISSDKNGTLIMLCNIPHMRDELMLGRADQVIPIAPPLCINKDEIDEAVARLDRVLTNLGKELKDS